jgi:hypothetical protein
MPVRARPEKEDGCRGYREAGKQPETLVEQGSNETGGDTLGDRQKRKGQGHSQAGLSLKKALRAANNDSLVRISSSPFHFVYSSHFAELNNFESGPKLFAYRGL